jgi:hypothetical protein
MSGKNHCTRLTIKTTDLSLFSGEYDVFQVEAALDNIFLRAGFHII